MKNFEALIDDGGKVTVGRITGSDCAATTADGHNTLAMLIRLNGETLNALLKCLDTAIGRYYDTGGTTDQINSLQGIRLALQGGAAGRSPPSSCRLP